jgi:signal transduction histidine kinase
MAHLDEALFQLDRVPSLNASAVGFAAHATDSYLAVSEATLDLLSNALGDHPNQEVAKWLEALRQLATLIHHTVGRLVQVSPPGEFPLKSDYVDLPLLMRRACDYHQRNAERKQLKIVCQSVGLVPPVWADRVAVAVVADNLLSNAVKSSDPGGVILVQITPGPGGPVCGVRDHGPGLSPTDQALVFNNGVPAGSAPAASGRSTGSALVVAKELIDRMGGRLWSESEPGQGTCVSFRLPYHGPRGPGGH